MALLLLLLLAAPSEVVFHNNTAAPIRITARHTTDEFKVRSPLTASWDLKPREKTALKVEGKPVVCHEFYYQLTTYQGTSNWWVPSDGMRQCLVTINDESLKVHRKELIRGGERLTRPTGRVRVNNTSGVKWTLTCRSYLDAHNDSRTVRGGPWTIDKGVAGPLDDLGTPLPVARFEFTLATDEGDSEWFVEVVKGDIPLVLDAAVYRRHLASIKAGRTQPQALGGATEEGRKLARERIEAAIHEARSSPDHLSDVLTHGWSARRDRVMLEQLQTVLPGRAAKELESIKGVLLRVQSGELWPKKGDVKPIVAALRRAGVSEPEEAAAFVILFAE
jgi:hypothetical protein